MADQLGRRVVTDQWRAKHRPKVRLYRHLGKLYGRDEWMPDKGVDTRVEVSLGVQRVHIVEECASVASVRHLKYLFHRVYDSRRLLFHPGRYRFFNVEGREMSDNERTIGSYGLMDDECFVTCEVLKTPHPGRCKLVGAKLSEMAPPLPDPDEYVPPPDPESDDESMGVIEEAADEGDEKEDTAAGIVQDTDTTAPDPAVGDSTSAYRSREPDSILEKVREEVAKEAGLAKEAGRDSAGSGGGGSGSAGAGGGSGKHDAAVQVVKVPPSQVRAEPTTFRSKKKGLLCLAWADQLCGALLRTEKEFRSKRMSKQRLCYERLAQEISFLGTLDKPPCSCEIWLDADREYEGTPGLSLGCRLEAPEECPYSGQVHELIIRIPEGYPYEPFWAQFRTPIRHPAFAYDACVGMQYRAIVNFPFLHSSINPLEDQWKPPHGHTLYDLLKSIEYCFMEPKKMAKLAEKCCSECYSEAREFLDDRRAYISKSFQVLQETVDTDSDSD